MVSYKDAQTLKIL